MASWSPPSSELDVELEELDKIDDQKLRHQTSSKLLHSETVLKLLSECYRPPLSPCTFESIFIYIQIKNTK